MSMRQCHYAARLGIIKFPLLGWEAGNAAWQDTVSTTAWSAFRACVAFGATVEPAELHPRHLSLRGGHRLLELHCTSLVTSAE